MEAGRTSSCLSHETAMQANCLAESSPVVWRVWHPTVLEGLTAPRSDRRDPGAIPLSGLVDPARGVSITVCTDTDMDYNTVIEGPLLEARR